MDDSLHAFVINLRTSTERRDRIASALADAGIAYTIVPAVDGRQKRAADFEQYDDRACQIRHGRSLNGGEVACYLSHLEVLKSFLDSPRDRTLVLEDDAGVPLDAASKVIDILRFLDERSIRWDVANLTSTRSDYCTTLLRTENLLLRRSYYFPMLTCANLWSRGGASRFLASRFGSAVRGPIDTELRSHLARTGGGLSVDPPIFRHDGHVSDIDAGAVPRRDAARGLKGRSPIVSRVVRHFPDYMHAHFQKLAGRFR
jgi:glycosyl transferase family 25